MRKLIGLCLLAAALAGATGCEAVAEAAKKRKEAEAKAAEEAAKKTKEAEAKRAMEAEEAAKARAEPTLSEVAGAPNPAKAADQPAAVRAAATADRIRELLTAIDARVSAVDKERYKAPRNALDVLEVARLMRAKVAAVGEDNWKLIRDLDRLNVEWDRAARGHAETAKELRREAEACETEANRKALVAEAEAHERQAADAPRRKERGLHYRATLAKEAAFFAETERALDRVAASVDARNRGGVPLLDVEGIGEVNQHLDLFLKLLEDMAKELRARDPLVEQRDAERRKREDEERAKAFAEAEAKRKAEEASPAGRRKRLAQKVKAVSPPLHAYATHVDRLSTFPWYTCGDCGKDHNRMDTRGDLYAYEEANRRCGYVAQPMRADGAELARRRALAGLAARLKDPAWAPTEEELSK